MLFIFEHATTKSAIFVKGASKLYPSIDAVGLTNKGSFLSFVGSKI